MKLIDEIIEVLEENCKNSAYFDVNSPAVQEFLSFEVKKPEQFSKHVIQQRTAPKPNIPQITSDQPQHFNYNKAEPIDGNFDNMKLEQLRQFVLSCRKCSLCNSRKHVVFGEGNPNAELMFIGEAPGREEDLQGKPFVGESGELLTKMIGAMGFKRDDVYIANVIKCRPPYNRNPNPEEAKYCLDFLNRQIKLIKPKVIVLLGAVPLHFLLGLNGITRLRGIWQELNGIKTMPTFHPAYLLREPSQKRNTWEDLQKVMKVLGKL